MRNTHRLANAAMHDAHATFLAEKKILGVFVLHLVGQDVQSSPFQVDDSKPGLCAGQRNLYCAKEILLAPLKPFHG